MKIEEYAPASKPISIAKLKLKIAWEPKPIKNAIGIKVVIVLYKERCTVACKDSFTILRYASFEIWFIGYKFDNAKKKVSVN